MISIQNIDPEMLPPIAKLTMIKEYIQWLHRTRKKAHELYFYAFKQYSQWLRKNKGIDRDVTTLMLSDFRPDWVEEHYRAIPNYHTANRFISAVKGLFKFVKNNAPYTSFEDILWLDRTMGAIDMIKRRSEGDKFSVGALTTQDIAKLILASTEMDELVYCSLILFLYTGSRASELATEYLRVNLDLNMVDSIVSEYGRALVDVRKGLMVIPIAKSENRYRVIPIQPIKDVVKFWLDHHHMILNYCRGKGRFWFNMKFAQLAKKAEVDHFRVHDLRRTVKTNLEFLPAKDWEINYWIGHVVRWERVPNKYRDMKHLLPKIYHDIVYSKEEVVCPKCLRVFGVEEVEDVCPACNVEVSHWKHFLLRILEGYVF